MTNNEQRAHDIAVAMLPTMFQNEVAKCASGVSDKIDIIAVYNQLYTDCLKHFEADN